MFFAIEKLSDLTNGITDKDCLKRLKSRQESYLFFLLMRFPKSNVSFSQLNGFVKKAKALQVYPLKNFIGDDYNGIRYRVLTFIINKKIALLLFMLILRIKHKCFLINNMLYMLIILGGMTIMVTIYHIKDIFIRQIHIIAKLFDGNGLV